MVSSRVSHPCYIAIVIIPLDALTIMIILISGIVQTLVSFRIRICYAVLW